MLSEYEDLETVTSAINHGVIYKFFSKPCLDDQLKGNIREASNRYEVIRTHEQLQLQLMNQN